MAKQHFSTFFTTAFIVILLLSMTLTASAEEKVTYTEVEWIALMPSEDLEALLNPPDLSGIPDGSPQDSFDTFQDEPLFGGEDQRFQEALRSTNVVTTYENKPIRIPGFVVPLASNQKQDATEFFIVPYFGACIHQPPPPPNQIIYSSYSEGLKVESLYQPFWFEGTLTIETNHNVLGTSAYRLLLDNVVPYEDE
jgi:hypothetical protein